MKLNRDQLAQKLTLELGADAVTDQPGPRAAHTVDGKEPTLLCFPETPEQVAAVLRVCSEAEAAVTPWGGGTTIGLGNPPPRVDVIIGLHRLNGLIEHDHANLTATVQAGISLAALQQRLSEQKQFLAFDPPFPKHATPGGVIAANLNGPRRMSYGSVRDLVIGVKVALASGEQIKGGGKVVKNVAGYDMCKLFVGSLGTLGIITEVTLRMAPIPETAGTLLVSGPLREAVAFLDQLYHSTLNLTAIVCFNAAASPLANSRAEWTVAVSSEGFEQTVSRHLIDVQTIAEKKGLTHERLRGDAQDHFWDEIRDMPLRPGSLVYRINAPRTALGEIANAVQADPSREFSPTIVADAGAGTLWGISPPHPAAAERFSKLTSLVRKHKGCVIMFAAPPALKTNTDIWGPLPDSFFIMQEIKRQFDPSNLLNPGRFVGAI
jgi:glycolate oxidase FAD binding subunit